MEFDPQLVIHLHRRGVPVVNLPTRVVYDPEGLSHFDMLRDNRLFKLIESLKPRPGRSGGQRQ